MQPILINPDTLLIEWWAAFENGKNAAACGLFVLPAHSSYELKPRN